jgi:ABC-2 type transport system permease protein
MKWEVLAMKLRTKLVNMELVKQILRRTGWVGILHFFILFLAMPVALYIEASQSGWNNVNGGLSATAFPHYERILDLGMVYQYLIFLICPILLSIFLYRYLTEKSATDFMHSAPISRKSLLVHYLAIGTVMLVSSILLVGLATVAAQQLSNLPDLFEVNDYLYWIARTCMYTLLVFYVGSFVGMITGNPVTHGFVAYFILLLPFAIFYLTFNTLRHLLYGLSSKYLMETSSEHLSPISSFLVDKVLTAEWIVYLTLLVILPILTFYIYKIRPSEESGNAFVFRILPPAFKYALTFVGMISGGTFYEGLSRGVEWMYFGLFIGALFGYVIAEILIQKSWRIIRQWKGFVAFCVLMFAIGGFIKLDIFGFVENVPQFNEVQSVYLTDNMNYQNNLPKDRLAFKSEKEIKAIIELHKQIVIEKPNLGSVFATDSLRIVYNLKNGSKIVREYNIFSNEDMRLKAHEVLYSKEADLNHVHYLESTVSKMKSFNLSGAFDSEPRVMLGDSDKMKGLLKNIRKDIELDMGSKHETPTYSLISLAIEFSGNNAFWNYSLPTRYKNAMNWLKENNYLDRLVLTPLQVNKLTVIHGDANNSIMEKLNGLEQSYQAPGSYRGIKDVLQGGQSVSDLFGSSKDKLVITDSEQIEKYMNRPDFATEKQIYYMKLDLHDGSYQIWTVNNTRRIGFLFDNTYLHEKEFNYTK